MAQLDLDDRGIVVTCVSCGQKNRVLYDRLGETVRCGRCKSELSATTTPLDVSTTADFDRLIAHASIPVVVDYWAPWCGPCHMIAPVIDQLAGEWAGRVRVVKLNVDDNPQTAARFGLRSIPTLLVMKDGREVDRLVGVQPKQEIARRLERAVA